MTNCNDQILISLLENKEDVQDLAAAKHLESCDSCQLRITQLAADQDSWHAAADALNDETPNTKTSVVIAVDRGLAADMPVQAEHISLDFLEAPSHPEMLGRIGRYDVERLIGAGGMGIVMKAYDTELHRPVAVKALAPHLAHSGGARQRFSREAQSAAAVVHENVVPIHNVDVDGKLPFLVMQYVDGESLQSRVERSGPLSPDEVLRLGKQIATGLAAAHAEGLVHRDVKPGNMLLEKSVDRVLITDFGLARAADDASMTRSGVIAGTPHYMSPEQARGEPIDIRSDLFGLGSVLYFMCTGHPPFRADGAMAIMHRICNDPHRPVDQVNEDVPADLAELIDQLLCKDTAKRPKDAQAVADTLTSLLHDKRSKTRFRKRKRKLMNSRWALVAASCFIAITAYCVWWGVNQNSKPAAVDLGLSGTRIADNSPDLEPPRAFYDDRFDNAATPVQNSRFSNAVDNQNQISPFAANEPLPLNASLFWVEISPATPHEPNVGQQFFNNVRIENRSEQPQEVVLVVKDWTEGIQPSIFTRNQMDPSPKKGVKRHLRIRPGLSKPIPISFESLSPGTNSFTVTASVPNSGPPATASCFVDIVGTTFEQEQNASQFAAPLFQDQPSSTQSPPEPIPLFADVNFDMELEDLKTLITELENRE